MASIALTLFRRKVEEVSALTGDKRVQHEGVSVRTLPIEAHDVQGLVFRGYGTLPHASYLLVSFGDGPRACAWLAELLPMVSPGVPAADERAVQLAFTHAGLAKLGLPEEALRGFSREFIAGMVDPHRSRFLGDEAESAPTSWTWGGPNSETVHAVLMLFARTKSALGQLQTDIRARFSAAQVRELHLLETAELSPTEHFGFADGISQPAIEGYHPAQSSLHRVKAGEFLLGYENEYGAYTDRPLLRPAHDPKALLPLDVEGSPRRDLGKNGSYLVFRQLRQNVPAFRQTLDALTRNEDGSENPRARALLAARMVGRWPSGAPLALAPSVDDPSKAKNNEFRYHDDDELGHKCPLGAHVRRANPRDALDPHPGSERSLSINRRHRLIRRGRTYGAALPEGAVDDQDRGLYFVSVNANISRQFEFVQHSWLNDPRFNGFTREADPIVGALTDNEFVVQADPVPTRCSGLPRFVTVVGGAYFFLPGLRALRFLSELHP